MKKLTLVLFSIIACTAYSDATIENARKLIIDGKAECVLISNGKIFAQEKGRGVNPLLHIYDTRRNEMKNGVIVDKVVGRAAAAIAINGKVRHVHGEVMSEDAVEFLKAHGISATHTLPVKRILNQKRNGLCPLEQSVQGIDDPAKALESLRKKIESFKK